MCVSCAVACAFSVVGPIPFLLAAIFSPGHPYIGSTTVLPDIYYCWRCDQMIQNLIYLKKLRSQMWALESAQPKKLSALDMTSRSSACITTIIISHTYHNL